MPENKKVFRNELKYVISDPEADMLKSRLSYFMNTDPHAGGLLHLTPRRGGPLV